jgi:4-hydroxy-tetrahydrodipicolinate synthase
MRLSGLFTALITPFKNGKLDERGLERNLDFQLAAGVDGVVILGTTSEWPTLTEEEKERIIQLTVERAARRLHVMVGTGGSSTAATIRATERARDMGADSALVVAPYYIRPTQRGLFEHFAAVAKAVDFPLIVYNNPTRTAVNIETMTLREIAQLPTVIGVKDSSGNVTQPADIIHQILADKPLFTLLCGDDLFAFPVLALGGHGLVSVLSNLAPQPLVEMVKSFDRGDWMQARRLHYQLFPLFKAMVFETNPMPIKEAMNMCDMPAGPCRLPLTRLSEPHRASLQRLLQESSLLPAGAPP